MKIALYRHIEYDFESAIIVNADGEYNMGDDYVRASETMDVDFIMIPVDMAAAKVSVIDGKISKAEAGIHLLKQTKAELLSIPDMRGE